MPVYIFDHHDHARLPYSRGMDDPEARSSFSVKRSSAGSGWSVMWVIGFRSPAVEVNGFESESAAYDWIAAKTWLNEQAIAGDGSIAGELGGFAAARP